MSSEWREAVGPFFGAEEEQNCFRPSSASFRRIAERNPAKASIRYLRARRLGPQEADGEVRGEGPLG